MLTIQLVSRCAVGRCRGFGCLWGPVQDESLYGFFVPVSASQAMFPRDRSFLLLFIYLNELIGFSKNAIIRFESRIYFRM